MMKKFSNFIYSFNMWGKLITIIIQSVVEIIRNPSFMMFSAIAIGLGTMGIWIGFLPGNSVAQLGNIPLKPLVQIIDNLSVFTFCIATLGSVATDYFFEEKNMQNRQGDDHIKELSEHGMFFLWALSALASFAALNSDDYIYCALGLTITFWLLVNIKKPKFQKINEYALRNLDPKLNDTNSNAPGMKGEGL